ncbi:MAG: hypothetical protein GF401_19000 [Chitinivibrionales bacterium]|nr:hypothetical protein [Chitinivibrionales bacterium]
MKLICMFAVGTLLLLSCGIVGPAEDQPVDFEKVNIYYEDSTGSVHYTSDSEDDASLEATSIASDDSLTENDSLVLHERADTLIVEHIVYALKLGYSQTDEKQLRSCLWDEFNIAEKTEKEFAKTTKSDTISGTVTAQITLSKENLTDILECNANTASNN